MKGRRPVKKRKRVVLKNYDEEQEQFDFDVEIDNVPLVLKLCIEQNYDQLLHILTYSREIMDEKRTDDGINALMYCSEKGLFEFARLLLTREFPLNSRDKFGNTELFYSLKSNRIDLINMLITNGSCRYIKNDSDKTVMDFAKGEVLQFLQQRPKTVFETVVECDTKTLEVILGNGFLANHRNSSGMSLLEILATTNKGDKRDVFETVKLLLKYGAEKFQLL